MARMKRNGLLFKCLERFAHGQTEDAAGESRNQSEAEKSGAERYCSNCHVLLHDSRCPVCGRKELKTPDANDYCFLTEQDSIWSGVFEDVLRQNEVPLLTENALGAGLAARMGNMLESVRFYVPYAHFHRAKVLEQELFSGVPLSEEDFE